MKNIQHPNTDHLAKAHKDTLSDGKAPTACSRHTRANILACVCFGPKRLNITVHLSLHLSLSKSPSMHVFLL